MDWTKLADDASIKRTIDALKGNNITAEVVADRKEALAHLIKMIPEGSEVMTAGSTTLDQIGLIQMLKDGDHKWSNVKDKIMAEKDPKKQMELRSEAVTAQYTIGSVHAITEEGHAFIASGSGSQIPGYAFSSPKVIWVIGAHKIVKTFEQAMERVKDYSLPLESERMKKIGYGGSMIGKLLIINKELVPNRIHVIIVKEILGF